MNPEPLGDHSRFQLRHILKHLSDSQEHCSSISIYAVLNGSDLSLEVLPGFSRVCFIQTGLHPLLQLCQGHQAVSHNAILTLPLEVQVGNKAFGLGRGVVNITLMEIVNSPHSQTDSLNCR